VTSEKPQAWRFAGAVALLAGTAFYFSTKAAHQNFDYTYRVALVLLRGHLGSAGAPPSWLSEMVPVGGKYYSVFPLGAVLVNIPVALLRKMGLIHNWPAHELAAVLAASCVFFFYRLSHVREISRARRVLLSLFPIFATWSWCILGFGGAWQIALGFALLGQVASLYYTLVRRNPLLAGAWFAVGPAVSLTWEPGRGPIGPPLFGATRQALELIGYFYGLGALIVAFGAFAVGRFSSRPGVAADQAVAGVARTEPPAQAAPGPATPRRRRLRLPRRRGAGAAREGRSVAP